MAKNKKKKPAQKRKKLFWTQKADFEWKVESLPIMMCGLTKRQEKKLIKLLEKRNQLYE